MRVQLSLQLSKICQVNQGKDRDGWGLGIREAGIDNSFQAGRCTTIRTTFFANFSLTKAPKYRTHAEPKLLNFQANA